jgi:hypothetical protein
MEVTDNERRIIDIIENYKTTPEGLMVIGEILAMIKGEDSWSQ